MTREEAIADIRDNIKPLVGGKSLDMAIKALEQQSELLILKANHLLRQAELKEWEENIKKGKKEGLIILPSYFEPILVPNDVEIRIEEEPKAEPQPKTEGARGDIPLQKNVPKMPQPCNDCISREAVLNIIKSICFSEEYAQFRADYGSNGQRDTAIIYIKALPSVTPQPKEEPQQKVGHWIEHKHGAIEHIECSECHVWFLKANLIRKSYCPNCGSCNGDMIKNIMKDIANNNGGKNEHI